MNVPEDLVAMVERVRIFREVTDANADQVMLEDTVKLVSILSKESSVYWQFSVFTVSSSKIKIEIIQYRKSRIWEVK